MCYTSKRSSINNQQSWSVIKKGDVEIAEAGNKFSAFIL